MTLKSDLLRQLRIRLNDQDAGRWDDEELNLYLDMAATDYSNYFPRKTTVETEMDGVLSTLSVPTDLLQDNIYRVTYLNTALREVILPIRQLRLRNSSSHYDLFGNEITLGFIPLDGEIIRLRYGAIHILSSGQIQTLTILGTPTGGTFTLDFDVETTSDLAYDCTAADVATALLALDNVDPGDVTASGGPFPDEPIRVTWAGQYLTGKVPMLRFDITDLTGGTDVEASIAGDSRVPITIPSEHEPILLLYGEAASWERLSGNDAALSRWDIDTGKRNDSPIIPLHVLKWRAYRELIDSKLQSRPSFARLVRGRERGRPR